MTPSCSARLYDRAVTLMPGGVSSPVRAYAPYPAFIASAQGCHLTDVDGNGYIDYCMGFGPLILGHAHPEVVEAVRQQAGQGMLYGAPTEQEVMMAERIVRHVPSAEMVRLVNTGTEATMHAIRLARGHTGRDGIVKMAGGFHGAHDSVLVKAGSGATTHSAPDSLGVPRSVTEHIHIVPYNDLDAMTSLLESKGDELAAVIMEPVLGNVGPIPPRNGYLEGIRRLTRQHDVLLIFDEVITGFRLSMGGAQSRLGIVPDMTVLGKVAGGGLPIGVFCGPKDLMEQVSPVGKVYQAGTFSGNPMSLAAGLATLDVLERGDHATLEAKGDAMRAGLEDMVQDLGIVAKVQGIGSMYQLFLGRDLVENYDQARGCDVARFMRLFHAMAKRGVHLPPSQFETNFLSTAHGEEDIEHTLDAYASALREVFV